MKATTKLLTGLLILFVLFLINVNLTYPSTVIKYNVDKPNHISIKVFDIKGNHIKTIVDEKLPAGSYEAIFNTSNLAGGIYFYQIESNNSNITKNIIIN